MRPLRILSLLILASTATWALPTIPKETQSGSNNPIPSVLLKGDNDPEISMGPAELIQRWDYPVEKYEAVTEDGYILSIYRIPHGWNESETLPQKPKPVVYFQHGLECSCTNWLTNLPTESAAYIFADAGFDVWMGNFRGTTYSKTHVSLSNKDHAYWEFSWDEMARYDLPAMIDLVLNVTGHQSLYYVGHSEGTMTAFAKFSEDLEFAKKIKQFHALAPVYTLKHVKGLLAVIAPFTHLLQKFFDFFGIDEFLPQSWLTEDFAKYFCGSPVTDPICENLLFLIAGPNTKQLNASRIPVYVAHSPAGTSVQNIAHFGQMVNSGKFDMYDYGSSSANMKRYNQKTPPTYDISKMQVPTALYWGEEDWLADQKDVQSAITQIRNLINSVFLDDFNHLDFVWGLRAAQEVYEPVLNTIMDDWKGPM